jgi:hypothetical protein
MQRIVHHVDNSGNYYLRPSVEIPFSGMFETISPTITWQTNSQSFRAARDAGPLSDKFRIATYGDSETFGWSVALEDTFQQHMERIDPDVEVLNLGIPGYNAENVADRMEATLTTWSPDLVVYLVNKNDVDLPNDISDAVLSSELLLRVRFFWQVVVKKSWRQQMRHSPERSAFLAGQLDRIARFAGDHRVPLLFVFMKSYTWQGALENAAPDGFVARAARGALVPASAAAPSVQVVLAEDWLRPFTRIDDHLPAPAHAVLARGLCERISGLPQGACKPAQWTPDDRTAPRTAGAETVALVADGSGAQP